MPGHHLVADSVRVRGYPVFLDGWADERFASSTADSADADVSVELHFRPPARLCSKHTQYRPRRSTPTVSAACPAALTTTSPRLIPRYFDGLSLNLRGALVRG